MHALHRHRAALLCTAIASLSGCGGGSGSDAPATSVKPDTAQQVAAEGDGARHGVLRVEESRDRFYLDAWFDDTVPAGTHGALPGPLPGQTVRTVLDRDGDRCLLFENGEPSIGAATLGGTEAITLRSREGVWASLAPQRLGDHIVYATELRSVREAFPDDVVVQLPGDVGAGDAVSISLSPMAPLTVQTPEDGDLAASEGRIVWSASNDARDRIVLAVRGESAALAPAATSGSGWSLACELVDDGRFELPDTILHPRPWLTRIARVRDTRIDYGQGSFTVEQRSQR